jgi:hypothetical protein
MTIYLICETSFIKTTKGDETERIKMVQFDKAYLEMPGTIQIKSDRIRFKSHSHAGNTGPNPVGITN